MVKFDDAFRPTESNEACERLSFCHVLLVPALLLTTHQVFIVHTSYDTAARCYQSCCDTVHDT